MAMNIHVISNSWRSVLIVAADELWLLLNVSSPASEMKLRKDKLDVSVSVNERDQLDVRLAARGGESFAGERELVVSGREALAAEHHRGFRPQGGRSAVHCEQRDGRGAHARVRGDRAQVPRRVRLRGDDRWRRLDPLRRRQAFESAHSRQRCLFLHSACSVASANLRHGK